MNSADEYYESIEKDYNEGKHKRDSSGKFSRTMDAHMETAEALNEDPEYRSRRNKQGLGAAVSVGGAVGMLMSRHPGAQAGLGATSLAGSGYSVAQGLKGNKRARKVAKPIFEKHGVGDLVKRDIESPFIRKAWDADPKVSKALNREDFIPPGKHWKDVLHENAEAHATSMKKLDAHLEANEHPDMKAARGITQREFARNLARVKKAESPFIAKAVGTQNRMSGMQQTESAMQQNAMQQATEMLAPQVAQQVMQMQQEAEQQFMREQQQLAMLGQQMNAGSPQSNLNTGPGTQGTYEMGPQLQGPRMASPPSLRSLSAGPKGPSIGPQ